MAVGRKKLELTTELLSELHNHLLSLKFRRKAEDRALQVLGSEWIYIDADESKKKTINKARALMSVTKKNMVLLHQITRKDRVTTFEREILELSQKTDIDSYFLLQDMLDTLRKKNDATHTQTKLKIKKERLENPPDLTTKEQNRKKFYLGSLLLKILEKKNPNLTDSNVFDILLEMTKHEKFGYELDQFLIKNITDGNRNLRNFRDNAFNDSKDIRNIIIDAKNDSRNPFKN